MRVSKTQKSNKVEIVSALMSIILGLFSVIIFFGAFNLGGKGGKYVFDGFYFLIGVFTYILPIIFVYSAYLIWVSKLPKLSIIKILSVLLFSISSITLLSSINSVWAGQLGNILGTYTANLLGTVPSVILSLGILYISMMLFFERKHLFKIDWQTIKDSEEKAEEIVTEKLKFFSFAKIKNLFKSKEIKKDIKEEKKMESEEIMDEEDVAEEDHDLRSEIFEKSDKGPVAKTKLAKVEDNEEFEEKITIKETKNKSIRIDPKFSMPPINLLNEDSGKAGAGDTVAKMKAIKTTMDEFGLPVEMGSVTVGPTVTQFTLKPAQGVKVGKILNLKSDLQLALSAQSIHIQAPIPGRPFVGIEVPNEKKQMLGLRSMIDNIKFRESSNLTVAIGKDIIGNPIYGDIAKMPHLLVAGATGSGKSVTVQNILMSLLYKNSPTDLKLIIIDPKKVEFTMYKSLPHLGAPIITDAKNAIKCLNWAMHEMERRYQMFAESHLGVQNIGDYNKKVFDPAIEKAKKSKNTEDLPERLPYTVIIFDEFNDFMLSYPKEITMAVTSLGQKARAAGIHLILATQRPDVKVINGNIKANLPARIALKTTSGTDSRTIIDQNGAEDLLGNGDILYMNPNSPNLVRIQAPFVSSEEIKSVIEYCKKAYDDYEEDKIDFSKMSTNNAPDRGGNDAFDEENGEEPLDDPEYIKAKEYVISSNRPSASALQSRFGWGYPKANKMIMMMERYSVVSGIQNNKRVVLNENGSARGEKSESNVDVF
jgi:S-DNA-T family DNA segregation ATPase FtsK/SpoIIIE